MQIRIRNLVGIEWFKQKWPGYLVLFLMMPVIAFAQETGTIVGQVYDRATGEPKGAHRNRYGQKGQNGFSYVIHPSAPSF